MLAGNLKALRDQRGLTLEKLAWSAGVDKGYLSRVEGGQRAPTLPVLRRLAGELGVEPWVLLHPGAMRGSTAAVAEFDSMDE